MKYLYKKIQVKISFVNTKRFISQLSKESDYIKIQKHFALSIVNS